MKSRLRWFLLALCTLRVAYAQIPPIPTATVLSVQGSVHAQNAAGKALALLYNPTEWGHSVLEEGARLTVGANGSATVRLSDGSVIRLGAHSTATLHTLPDETNPAKSATRIDLNQGRMDAKVQPQRAGKRSFEVHTPLALAGVRGTEFGVSYDAEKGFASDVTQGEVSIQSNDAEHSTPTLLRAGDGVAVEPGGRMGEVQTVLPPMQSAAEQSWLVRDNRRIMLTYQVLPGAQKYQFDISADSEFVTILRSAVVRRPIVQFPGLPGGSYWVSARAISQAGMRGLEAKHTLTVQTLKRGRRHVPQHRLNPR